MKGIILITSAVPESVRSTQEISPIGQEVNLCQKELHVFTLKDQLSDKLRNLCCTQSISRSFALISLRGRHKNYVTE